MRNNSISVLMSVYNETESQIRESVGSMLTQTYYDFELIVVNDNPKREDVITILNRFNDNRIRFYQNPDNVGLALSMNKAAKLATSNIFARMDADDVAEPMRLETDIKYILKGYDVVFSNYSFIDETSNTINTISAPICHNDKLARSVALEPSIIHHPTTCFTREIFERVGGYRNFPCSQDADMWLRMTEAGASFYYLPQKLLRYRINSQSVSSKRWYKQQLTCNYIYELSLARLSNGQDTFSIENYNKFLERWRISDCEAERKLKKCYYLLSKARMLSDNGRKIEAILLRFWVFIKSPLLRNHYFMQHKKKRLVQMITN